MMMVLPSHLTRVGGLSIVHLINYAFRPNSAQYCTVRKVKSSKVSTLHYATVVLVASQKHKIGV